MKFTIAALFAAAANASLLQQKLDEKRIRQMVPDLEDNSDVLLSDPSNSSGDLYDEEGNIIGDEAAECGGCYGYAVSCPQPIIETGLDAAISLPSSGLGSAVLTGYTSGNSQNTSAANEDVPDRLYYTDAVAATDSCSSGTEATASNKIGTRTFSISGSVTIDEQYQDQTEGQKSSRERSQSAGHKESRTALACNQPGPSCAPEAHCCQGVGYGCASSCCN